MCSGNLSPKVVRTKELLGRTLPLSGAALIGSLRIWASFFVFWFWVPLHATRHHYLVFSCLLPKQALKYFTEMEPEGRNMLLTSISLKHLHHVHPNHCQVCFSFRVPPLPGRSKGTQRCLRIATAELLRNVLFQTECLL